MVWGSVWNRELTSYELPLTSLESFVNSLYKTSFGALKASGYS